MQKTDNEIDKVNDLVKRAKLAGADAADAIYVEGTSLSISCRKGLSETLSRSEGMDIGLRVFLGQRQAMVSSSDFSSKGLDELVDRCISMARVVPEDEFCGLAPEDLLAEGSEDLDNFDPIEITKNELGARALEAEDAALSIQGVTNSEGAEASWGRSLVALAASNGFASSRHGSSHSISVSVLAGEGTSMERDYDYTISVHSEDLMHPKDLGRSAGNKATSRLNPRKVATSKVPIVFDPRVSNSLLSHFSSAINGASVARGTTFLKDKLGKKIFGDDITICDDPLRLRGLRSKEFDAEGVKTTKHDLVEGGVLKTWLLDVRSAKQLKMKTTGHASRGTSSSPSPSATNIYMEPGKLSPEDLVKNIDKGFYVTELIGMGIDGVTGDYSRGATGFWIESGEIAFPVSELTIAGNLNDMYLNLTPADDLEYRFFSNCPTIRVDGLITAGK